jgi:hypothetical protein
LRSTFRSVRFSNKIVEHTSGEETATSYWENPKWDYTVTFDYLPDYPKSVGDSDLRMMMGFFLQCTVASKRGCSRSRRLP